MLHDKMNICCLMDHTQQVDESRLRRKNREANIAKLLKVILQREGWILKINQHLRRCSQIDFILKSMRIVIMVSLNLSPESERVETDIVRSLLEASVVKIM